MSENHATALQPSLLDRLTDDEPQRQAESPTAQVLGRHALRAAVLRDLAWLMNTTRLAALVLTEDGGHERKPCHGSAAFAA